MSLEILRNLCAKYWNPIGFPMESEANAKELEFPPLPADEYDTYLKYVEKMLQNNASDQQIIAYLETVERDFLELTSPAGNKSEFVSALKKLRF